MKTFLFEDNTKLLQELITIISPKKRLIVSDGLIETFDYLKNKFPELILHHFKTNTVVDDWCVPPSWFVKKAYLENERNEIIVDYNEQPLFVVPYSISVNKWFSKKELSKHVRFHPYLDNVFFFEHRLAYDHVYNDWAITLPKIMWDNLEDSNYYLCIESDFKEGDLIIGDYFIKGESNDTIVISAHIDELCNDDLSGCIAGLNIMKHLKKYNPKYSYRLLLFPELFGPIFYLNKCDFSNFKYMINLETVGNGKEWCFKSSLHGNSYIDNIVEIFNIDYNIIFKKYDFFGGYGNDERVFEWPKYGIPSVAFQRFPFEYYHSSLDTPEIISYKLLNEITQYVLHIIEYIENDYIPEYTMKSPPWLRKNNLYYDAKDDLKESHKYNNLLLYNINNKNKVSDLAKITGIKFNDILKHLDNFINLKYIKKNEIW